MKTYAAKEIIHWQLGVKTDISIDVPDDVVREIELAAVNRYRRALDRLFAQSNASKTERSRFRVLLFSIVP